MKSKSLIKIFLLFLLVIYVNDCTKEKLFSVHIIDVGQGDSIFIQTPENKRILIDAGDEEAEHTVYSYLKRKGKLFSVHIIDVGQGDSIFIQTPENKRILIDAGDEEAEHTVYSYLKRKGVKKIDVLIATHPDTDHIGSMDYIIDKFKISHFYMPDAKTDSEAFYNLLDSCNRPHRKYGLYYR